MNGDRLRIFLAGGTGYMDKLAELLPQTRVGARRLGLVTLEQMTSALTVAVETRVQGRRFVTVPGIRAARCVESRVQQGI